MTRKEWFLKYLPKDIAEKAIANTIDFAGERWLDDKVGVILNTVISGGFIFDLTPEGRKFWEDIDKKYGNSGR